MSLHMIKLSVGSESIDTLAAWQQTRIKEAVAQGLSPNPRHYTRVKPKREAELLDGGSIYWVIKGAIRARQNLVAFESYTDEEGVRRCAIVLDPELVPTRTTPHRAFQGWRYLTEDKAPQDAVPGEDADLPDDLARDLQDLGLL